MRGPRRDCYVSSSPDRAHHNRLRTRLGLAMAGLSLTMFSFCIPASGQSPPVGNCKPVSERTGEVGCWIIAHQPVGPLTRQTSWYLDVFPTRAAAEAAKGPHGTVVESLGKVWLLTVERAAWLSSKCNRVAEIGPLPIVPGEEYSAPPPLVVVAGGQKLVTSWVCFGGVRVAQPSHVS